MTSYGKLWVAHIRLFLEVHSQLDKVQVVDIVSDVPLGKMRSYEAWLAFAWIDGTFYTSRLYEKIITGCFAGLLLVVQYSVPLCCVVPCRSVVVLCLNVS